MQKKLYTTDDSTLQNSIDWFRRFDAKGIPNNVVEWMWEDVIWNAVKGKYSSLNRTDVKRLIHEDNSPAIDDAGKLDVLRQKSIMRKIENEWRTAQLNSDLLVELYCLAYGITHDNFHWRQTNLILTEGYQTEIAPELIEKEMEKFWKILSTLNTLSIDKDFNYLLRHAAKAFTFLIYTHPFPDGNGRVARFIVNLLFRKWSLPYITIPKVKNSPIWLNSLQRSLKGDVDHVTASFREWLSLRFYQIQSLNGVFLKK